MKILLIALVLLTAQISFADECILKSAIRSYSTIDETSVQIDAGRKDYVVDVGFCRELLWANKIAFDTFGSSRVCRGDKLLVINTFNEVVDSCFINKITRF